ncbi:MAG: hypothetical protein P3W93_004925 [Thermus sp.]|nr:hypothetical protein [Thermus sp.]
MPLRYLLTLLLLVVAFLWEPYRPLLLLGAGFVLLLGRPRSCPKA